MSLVTLDLDGMQLDALATLVKQHQTTVMVTVNDHLVEILNETAMVSLGQECDQEIKIHGLSIRPYTNTCLFENESVPLTPKEYDLLLILVLRYPQVVSKKDIYRHVWGNDMFDPGVIKVHMWHLRRKLSQASGGKVAVSYFRPTGYKLDIAACPPLPS